MKKQSIFTVLMLLASLSVLPQMTSDKFAKLDRIDDLHFRITNLQQCSTAYKLTGAITKTTVQVPGDSSIVITLTCCGNTKVMPITNCADTSMFCDLSVNTCTTLPVKVVYFYASKPDQEGKIYVEIKLADAAPQSTYKLNVKLKDGSKILVDFPLDKRKGDSYYNYITPEQLR